MNYSFNNTKGFLIYLLPFLLFMLSCKKSWLDAKPQRSLVVPTKISDYQALLDNSTSVLGGAIPFNAGQNSLGEISAGDFFVSDASYASISETFGRSTYIWAPDIYEGSNSPQIADWNDSYQRIFYSNVVLDGLEEIKPINDAEQKAWNNVKGTALFMRAYNHFSIAQTFCKPYDKSSSLIDLGIPLRITSDFNEKTIRSSVEQTYTQIVKDLQTAVVLLPDNLPNSVQYKLRPTQVAANAMLARVFLSMEDYQSALQYADKVLLTYDSLIDYNSIINPNSANPISQYNKEVIWHTTLNNYSVYNNSRGLVDSNLYKLYDQNDLRKKCFFNPSGTNYIFKGSYNGNVIKFSGLATDEIFLIRAECNARLGNIAMAIQDLNELYRNRWLNLVPYNELEANTIDEALSLILDERRKELCFRGLRWTDLRRLNKDPKYAKTIVRIINGQPYTLSPNDYLKYVLPIPFNVIQLSGIQQNPRL